MPLQHLRRQGPRSKSYRGSSTCCICVCATSVATDRLCPRKGKARCSIRTKHAMSGEASVDEGKEVTILEGDGTLRTLFCNLIPTILQDLHTDTPSEGGWTKIRAGFGGQEGLVPTAYLEILPQQSFATSNVSSARPHPGPSQPASVTSSQPAKKKGPAVAPRRGARRS